jgi:hypothetical protein
LVSRQGVPSRHPDDAGCPAEGPLSGPLRPAEVDGKPSHSNGGGTDWNGCHRERAVITATDLTKVGRADYRRLSAPAAMSGHQRKSGIKYPHGHAGGSSCFGRSVSSLWGHDGVGQCGELSVRFRQIRLMSFRFASEFPSTYRCVVCNEACPINCCTSRRLPPASTTL